MIEKIVYSWLVGSERLKDLVDDRIFTGHAPQGTQFPFVIIRETRSDRVYHLQNEADIRFDTVEVEGVSIDRDDEAESIGRAIHNRLAGIGAVDVTWTDYDGSERTTKIHDAVCADYTFVDEPPRDSSDRWLRGLMTTFRLAVSQPEPTHT